MKLRAWLATLLLGSTGCAHVALDDTYGLTFNTIFGAQLADRQAKDSPLRGEDTRRVIAAYYDDMAPDPGSSSGGASAASQANRGPPPAPTPFRIGAH